MQSSESGRKINQAVNTTSRAVGGAITQAKGAFSYWWSSITTAPASGTSNASDTRSSNSDPTAPGQDITVSFQNIEDNIEVGISVHTEEKVTINAKLGEGGQICLQEGDEESNSDSGKQIDSAEELVEENEKLRNVTEPRGIVEIGREAEVLNTEESQNLSDAAASCSNGSIFIV